MHKVSLALAILGSAVSLAAQSCGGAAPARQFSNRAEFEASFYYLNNAHIFDLNVQVPITLSGAHTWLYDQGVGNPPVPDQVGNLSVVDVYTCPLTRIGNETNAPTNPGSPWTLLGSGTMTVVNTGVGNGESPIVFNPPLSIPAGQYGVCFVYNNPTTGLNPGPLHCLGKSPNPATPVTDGFITFSNDGIVGTAWTGVGTDSPNLRLDYLPAATSGHFEPLGDGCYFRPYAFYESFPNGVATPDLANTSQSWVSLVNNYLVVPGTAAFIPPTSANLAAGATGSSSSANWDDALSTPIVLPFTFSYPGGSTNEITISSNGSVYLANVVDSTYAICGASYGSIAPFRDGPARIAAFYHDLDPTVGGGIYYDVDPNNQWVRITWDSVQEWGVAAAVNTIQVTLSVGGGVDIYYGSLGNQSGGNNAIAGFTPGTGSRLAPAMDLSASIPFQSGDGQIPPVLTMDARPVIGTTPNVVTTNITPGTFFQVFVAGFTGVPAPVSLAAFGMPDCFQYINPFTAFLSGLNGNGEFSVAFNIPNNPAYQGVTFYFQSAPLTGGLNAAGIITSNGICATLGL